MQAHMWQLHLARPEMQKCCLKAILTCTVSLSQLHLAHPAVPMLPHPCSLAAEGLGASHRSRCTWLIQPEGCLGRL